MATASKTPTSSTPEPEVAPQPSTPVPWVPLIWITALVIVAYLPVLQRLVQQWMDDEDMGHGFFVPVVAAYIAWQRRDAILALTLKSNNWGLAIMALGAVQLILGTVAAELFLSRTAIVITAIGVVTYAGGIPLLRLMAFPLALLCFMVPLPAVIYNQITFPLQLFASAVAETALNMIGIPVLRDGNVLELSSGQKLSVVEACSGIRSLLSLTFLSLIYGFFFDQKPWMRAVLLAGTIPIAIAANSFRVTLTGIIAEYKREWAEGFFHSAEGWVIFMFALTLLITFHRVVNWIYQGAKNARAQAIG